MTRIIAISNHKGGVGKTTSVVNIGAGLANLKKKVLMVDFDPQANLTQSLNIKGNENSLYKSMKGEIPLQTIEIGSNLFLTPSCPELSNAESELNNEAGREYIFKELLEPIEKEFDFVIIDCPPSLGLLTVNAFTASSEIIIPMQAEFLALQGISKLLALMDKIKKRINKDLKIGGIFITQYDQRKVLNRYVLDTIETHFKNDVFKTKIRDNIALAEAPNSGLDIFRYQAESKGADDYLSLCKEILKKN